MQAGCSWHQYLRMRGSRTGQQMLNCDAGRKKSLVTRSPEARVVLQGCPKWNQGARPFYTCVDQSLDAGWPWRKHNLEQGSFLRQSVDSWSCLEAGGIRILFLKGDLGGASLCCPQAALWKLLRKASPCLQSWKPVADTINCPLNSKWLPLFFFFFPKPQFYLPSTKQPCPLLGTDSSLPFMVVSFSLLAWYIVNAWYMDTILGSEI